MKACFRFAAALSALFVLASASQAHIEVFMADLDGPSEAPPNGSPGIGTTTVTWDLDLATMRVQAEFSGLLGTTTASHIHGPTSAPHVGTAGVATQLPSFSGFPLGVTSGTFDQTFDMTLASSYNPAFVTANGGTVSGAMNALLFAMREERTYLNIHSTMFPGGEIRGFLVPEPGTLAVVALGALAVMRRRRISDLKSEN